MNKTIRKMISLILTVSVGFALAGCGKENSAEESMQAELESLRAQLAEQETAQTTEEVTEETEETEAVAETAEETEETVEEERVYPFPITKERTNLAIGEIAEYEDFCVGLAGVRMFDEYESMLTGSYSYYASYIPVVPDGQVAVTPIFQIYNASDDLLEYDDELISLYVDNVQVSRVDVEYTNSYWVDGLEELIYTDLDAGEGSTIVSAFNVDENWSTLTVFYGDISWTVSREEIMQEPYVYSSMFNQGVIEATEPGTTVYRNTEYELVYDGTVVYSEGLRIPYLLFEFTINNTTDSVLSIDFPSHMRAYYEHRLLENSGSLLEEPINGYNNLHTGWGTSTLEIHPGMSSKVFVSFPIVETSGTFECYFETVDEGVVAVVCSAV